ncbi:acyl carrier protein [Crocinitomicaceae bacterium CZZ-1]|uniref:Acyl carrier protein n=1 Tax=Taishania pollutisoli TaxID=2766479 RepID=A0A8J6P6Y3_9FLAO|nr:phosphopantetheine-binding protein [Taishania pollutisoli]MBC9810951.1 acyl carrier protein [Taishania pollutisoli]MBX2950108.1 acyl carrier protein [Crocinitomicaceae bacterium]NGF77214.1 acyl carrier protein [Fluviicola sp. SGL-29]
MNRAEIITTTKRFLSEEFEVDESLILPENNLHSTLDLDSLDYVDLVVVIEENLGFKPTSDDFKAIVTFNDFYDLAEQKIAVA